jgi:hypothetical protein
MVPTPTFVRQVSLHDEKRPDRRIAVSYFNHCREKAEAAKKPTVVYVPGFMSHGKAVKSEHLSNVCSQSGFNFVCYDPEGEGDFQSTKTADLDKEFLRRIK